MRQNLLIGQSGGPTAAINASLAGAFAQAVECPEIGEVYGARNGIEGLLRRDVINLKKSICSKESLQLLKETPAMALGSCRFKLPNQPSEIYQKILEIFREYEIGYFLYIGGNDSMDTVKKLSDFFLSVGEKIKVIGVPKTIDNDLCCTDHSPGFGSAAKFIATCVSEISCDSFVYNEPSVTIVETMGRNTGWLAAAASLARLNGNSAPHMIYLPEIAFDPAKFMEDLNEKLKGVRHVVVIASEGLKLENGDYVADGEQIGKQDNFGHKYLSGIGIYMEDAVREKLCCKVRSVNLNVLQRSAAHLSSATDIGEASAAGAAAVKYALLGKTGIVSIIRRLSSNPYKVAYESCDVGKVANYVKYVPTEWIAPSGYDITPEMTEYLKPLILGEQDKFVKNGLPMHYSFVF